MNPDGPSAGSGRRLTATAVAAELTRLTLRDHQLLIFLADHRTFTTEQLADLTFGSIGRARNRLNTLRSRNMLDRFRHYHRPGSQSWRWTLGPVGAAIVATGRDEPWPRPATVREATARLALSPRLGHLIGVNGFFVALTAHSRTHPGTALTRWWPEARARKATGDAVRPDGHGVWAGPARRVAFWFEHDTGTERLAIVASKLAGYAHLAGTRHAYPVLIWLPTTVRETNLHTHLARAGIPAGVTVATAAADHAGANNGPAGQVWRVAGRPDRLTLAGLPPTTLAGLDNPGGLSWDG
ncbi:MAG: replication-relaxation family protein [Dactylosporangium sp.]|nr:replication-relaxation family protein [Dactylosporangium sp.]NNJ63212.1 replication-relaxation family protein [Dactylosporangium sp.]